MTYSYENYQKQGLSLRSDAASGVDLSLTPMGDIEIINGDFKLERGTNNIIKAFLRRLHTPPYGYKRFIRTFTDVQQTTEDYGNEMYFYLSAPITTVSLEQIKTALVKAVEADGRIKIMSFGTITKSLNKVFINEFTYIIRGEEELKSLNLVLDNGINNV